ncbi:MAG: DedA family protein [Chloroherpetonaceae bacterium]|nr:DedA family protein [Chthonomonadaceae bacterium]MDW8207522.1 DedA family protein [Chloroherpetonaceae bacterium]
MDFKFIADLFLHLDRTLGEVIRQYDTWTYLILFLIVFAETGLVVTPFLPGDSLLFAAGTFAATGQLQIALVFFLLVVAAILGDTINYAIGKYLGPKIFHSDGGRFLRKEYLDRTHEFYEKHGARTIILARFVPIVRTFAPFVAGIGRMSYGLFVTYNVVGAFLWVTICTFAGYFFGRIPVVQKHFSLAILAIVALSVVPMLLEIVRHRAARRATEGRALQQEARS